MSTDLQARQGLHGASGSMFGETDETTFQPGRVGRLSHWVIPTRPCVHLMETLVVSTLAVAIAEIGDKTQLLSLLLATRFRKPVPIIIGILLATLANHALAAFVGTWVKAVVPPELLRWLLGFGFLAIAVWTLKPDSLDEGEVGTGSHGVLLVTLVAFFIAEIGDKTQIATVALAARFDSLTAVVLGTTAGMMLVNAPVVYFGNRFAARIPLKVVRMVAAGVFLGIAVVIFFGVGFL